MICRAMGVVSAIMGSDDRSAADTRCTLTQVHINPLAKYNLLG